jgi:hypothetical protein
MAQILLIIGCVLLAVWLLRKVTQGEKRPSFGRAKVPGQLSSVNNPYDAVSIHAYEGSCPAVKQVVRRRFLPSEAPHLPLEACTAGKCHCVYRHHSDRRGGTDRRAGKEFKGGFLSTSKYQNRRVTESRRASACAMA